jgi:hypothetical protein
MSVPINCPSCRGPLRVPDELFGQRVQCPTCRAIFSAEVDEPPTVRVAPPHAPSTRPRLRYDDGSYAGDGDRTRSYRQPHRGGTILALGILSLLFHCAPLGIVAWVMGGSDLAAMRRGEMDRAGEGTTQAGRVCGIIASALFIIGAACGGVAFLFRLLHSAVAW